MWSLPCQPANQWNTVHRAYRADLEPTLPTSKSWERSALSQPSHPKAYLVNQQIIGIWRFEPFEPTEPAVHLNCQAANLEHSALSIPSRPQAYLANQHFIGIHCFELSELTSSLPRAYLANQQILGIHWIEPTEPTSSLPWQPANHQNTLL